MALTAATAPCGAAAQRVTVTELRGGARGVVATQDFWGADLGVARRHPGGRREALSVAVGEAGGAPAVRATAAVQFVLMAVGVAVRPYGGVGVTYAGAEGARSAGYLAVMLGVEGKPGRARGWFVEAGVEGGVHLAAGLCWRLSPARRTQKHEGRSVERPVRLRSDLRPVDQLAAPTGIVRATTGRQ